MVKREVRKVRYVLQLMAISFTLLGSFVLLTNSISAKIIYVDNSGGGDFLSIQDAIDYANESDIIQIMSGEYHEHVIINKSVSMQGDESSNTIISFSGDNTIKVTVNNVTISNIKIQNSRASSFSCIQLSDVTGCNISNIIAQYGGNTLYLINSYDVKIQDSTIEAGNTGISFFNSDRNTIKNNSIQNNNVYGISLSSNSDDNLIFFNAFSNNLLNNARDLGSNFWFNDGHGNYWDNYGGPDNNSDGVGDWPYVIDDDSQDIYPLLPSLIINDHAHEENKLPEAFIDIINPSNCTQGENINFSGHGIDVDGAITTYSWKSSLDGELNSSSSFTSRNLSLGTHTIYFKVKDNDGEWSSEVSTQIIVKENVNVDQAPIAIIDCVQTAFVNQTIHFDAARSYVPGVAGPNLTYSWIFGDGKNGSGKNTTHIYKKSNNYTVTLWINDDYNHRSSNSTVITITEYSPSEISKETPGFPFAILILSISIFLFSKRRMNV
jgi:parallel beta-helix repeat protein